MERLLDLCLSSGGSDLGGLIDRLRRTTAGSQHPHHIADGLRQGVALLKERSFSAEGSWQLPISKKAFRRLVKEALSTPTFSTASGSQEAARPTSATPSGLEQDLLAWLPAGDGAALAAQASAAATWIRSRQTGPDPLRLAFFVCPPMDYRQLWGPAPESFVLTSVETALLRRHMRRLQDLLAVLVRAGAKVSLLALVGDTDERDYLWRRTGAPVVLRHDVIAQRRELFRAALYEFLEARMATAGLGASVDIEVRNLSALMPDTDPGAADNDLRQALRDGLQEAELAQEMAFMRSLWRGDDAYYHGLPCPSEPVLLEAVRDKFITYALQGRRLLDLEPLLLIQTERPPQLRMNMLNAARIHEAQAPLLALQFYPQ
ncbi:hypothetical protein [Roseateles sp. YR242]|uniref:hypothetical protein n=1 Tax=Roseateles sp. YR242 TaxID=1855305 RepID=UPI0011605C3D|nr:hypothetical protein [Roseateles sp. YR242]